jgi:hypothetical protein
MCRPSGDSYVLIVTASNNPDVELAQLASTLQMQLGTSIISSPIIVTLPAYSARALSSASIIRNSS